MRPVLLSIAGSDCSAGAGLQADIKTGYALGAYPLSAVSCVVNEVPGKVEGIVPMPADFVAAQVRLCLQSYPVRAVKTGMLYSPEIVRAVGKELANYDGPLVIDPVMIATAGEPLMLQEALAAYEEDLFPRCTLLTPNVDELMKLTGCPAPQTVVDLQDAAAGLAARYRCAVLAKGGHLAGDSCHDVLVTSDGHNRCWRHPRCQGISTHGTGCTLSSACAAYLAHGEPLELAVPHALEYVVEAISQSLKLGKLYALRH